MPDNFNLDNPKGNSQSSRVSAFVSYSPKDKKYLQELQDHLAYYIRTWNLPVWDDTRLLPGEDKYKVIDKALQSAAIAVLLVSPDFFQAERITRYELPALLAAEEEGKLIVLCVILRACAFDVSELARFQPVNASSNPLSSMSLAERDEVWKKVAEIIWQKLSSKGEEAINESKSKASKAPASMLPPENAFAKKRLTGQQNAINQAPACDICIACALEEEVKIFMRETARLCQVTFKSVQGQHTKRQYHYTTIVNNKGEPLTLYVTWPPAYGPEETALHFKSALDELKPRFAAMTGFCAGDKGQKVVLGDIIVAECAFRHDTGKFVLDVRNRKKQLYDTRTQNLNPNILHFVTSFDGWQPAVAGLKRPISKRQQRDWLLNALLDPATPCVDAILPARLRRYVPDWRTIVHQLQKHSSHYLNDDRTLCDPEMVRSLYFGTEVFPYQDPKQPVRYIAPMASSSAVHSDNPFEAIRVPVRGTLAVDMEGATFYRTVADFPGILSLVVKGVCDYADPDKDDSYHEYAAAVSASYILSFIKEYDI